MLDSRATVAARPATDVTRVEATGGNVEVPWRAIPHRNCAATMRDRRELGARVVVVLHVRMPVCFAQCCYRSAITWVQIYTYSIYMSIPRGA